MGASSTSFKKGQKRPANAGRKKGTPNKSSTVIRDRLEERGFDIVDATIGLFQDPDTPPEIKFKCLYFLADFSYYKPKNPLDLPGAVPPRPDTDEATLSDEELEEALDGSDGA